MAMELDRMLYSLLGRWRDLCQRMRAAERGRGNARYRGESLVRQADDAKGVVIEAMDRKCNAWTKAIRGTNDETNYMGKEIEVDREGWECRDNILWRWGELKHREYWEELIPGLRLLLLVWRRFLILPSSV